MSGVETIGVAAAGTAKTVAITVLLSATSGGGTLRPIVALVTVAAISAQDGVVAELLKATTSEALVIILTGVAGAQETARVDADWATIVEVTIVRAVCARNTLGTVAHGVQRIALVAVGVGGASVAIATVAQRIGGVLLLAE